MTPKQARDEILWVLAGALVGSLVGGGLLTLGLLRTDGVIIGLGSFFSGVGGLLLTYVLIARAVQVGVTAADSESN